ncbi:MAG: hypothetical protein GVY11_00295 [Gammaproteobacteria bacterium]|jgi:hypothetical protein|nr:hypothetical protein [Gammaproteobacteria bacterium]
MPNRFLLALIAGMLTGLVIGEGIAAGARLFAPGVDVYSGLRAGTGLDEAVASILALSWLGGACVSAAMATAISRQRGAGWLIGLLWLMPAVLVVSLAGLAEWMLVVASLASLGGALVGTRVAERVGLSD